MTSKNAQKLVGKLLPGYKVKPEEPKTKIAADAAAERAAVEVVSPSLSALKRRYFGDSAPASPAVEPDSDDSGIVQVEKKSAGGAKSAGPRAVIFSKGKIIGRQG
jgi:hypothetical protein